MDPKKTIQKLKRISALINKIQQNFKLKKQYVTTLSKLQYKPKEKQLQKMA